MAVLPLPFPGPGYLPQFLTMRTLWASGQKVHESAGDSYDYSPQDFLFLTVVCTQFLAICQNY